MLNGLKHCTTALASYCFIILAKTEMKNTRLSVLAILGVDVKTMIADDKYSLRNRQNLQHSIPRI